MPSQLFRGKRTLFGVLRAREGGIPVEDLQLSILTGLALGARLKIQRAKLFLFNNDLVCLQGTWADEVEKPWYRNGPAEEIEKDKKLWLAGEVRRAEAKRSLVAWDEFFNEPRSEEETKLAFRKLFYFDNHLIRMNGLAIDFEEVHQLSTRADRKAMEYMSTAFSPKPISEYGTALEKAEDVRLRCEGKARDARSDDATRVWLAYQLWHRQAKRDLKARRDESRRLTQVTRTPDRMLG
jgi:hypothetical protein